MKAAALAALWLACACPSLGGETEGPVFQNVVVRKGDTLWGISHTYLKDPAKWDQILRYNKLPTSDPTVALPGMVLRVPIQLIKESLRAARLVYRLNRVLFRRRETADWKPAADEMELFRGDSLRTLEASKAKVKFLNADYLNLDANSMAVIKPPNRDYDVELKTGGLFVGRAKVVTASAKITPKTDDTQYSAKVRQDLSTLVEVHAGLAAVEAQGRTVDVRAGMASEVKLGLAPGLPVKIADLPDFEARAAEFTGGPEGGSRVKVAAGAVLPSGAGADQINRAADAADIQKEVSGLSVGVPISGYRVQASRTTDFARPVYDKIYDADTRLDFSQIDIPPGVYWWRVALIDLLGVEEKFSAPKLYSVGLGGQMRAADGGARRVDLKSSIVLIKPAADMEVTSDRFRVTGLLKDDSLAVTVNGESVRLDESGNFFLDLRLKNGPNTIAVTVRATSGDSMTLTRRVIYYP